MQQIKRIGNFEIIAHLGRGGMGDVYKAVQQPLGRTVAVKVLFSANAHDEEALQRFEIEAKAISRLEHTNIVSLYDSGVANGFHYFSMQFVDGVDLFSQVGKRGMPVEEVIDYSKQLCRGLLYAHKLGVVHRDIKPHNILLDGNRVCKITDFGIAQLFREKSITMTGTAVGTPEYMSPEQASGLKLDNRTDVYSLGIVMYEMLTGKVPFTGKGAVAVAYKQVHELPAPPSVHKKGIPKRLELIVLKAMKKDRNERYQSLAEMLDDIDTIEADDNAPLFATVAEKKDDSNRRITDRRNGDRRTDIRRTGVTSIVPFQPLSGWFWLNTLKQQWLSLVLVALLYLIVLLR